MVDNAIIQSPQYNWLCRPPGRWQHEYSTDQFLVWQQFYCNDMGRTGLVGQALYEARSTGHGALTQISWSRRVSVGG